MAVPQERLARQCRGIEGARQTPKRKTLAETVEPVEQRSMRRDPFKPVALEDAHDLCRPESCRQRGLGANGPDVAPTRLSVDIIGEGPQRIDDPVPHCARPSEIGTAVRIARQMLVPEVQCPDLFPHLDIGSVGERDGCPCLRQSCAQDAMWVIDKLVDAVIRAEYCIGPGDRARPQLIRPCGGGGPERGHNPYCSGRCIGAHDATSLRSPSPVSRAMDTTGCFCG